MSPQCQWRPSADEETPLLHADHGRSLRHSPSVISQPIVSAVHDDICFLTPAIIPPAYEEREEKKDDVSVKCVSIYDDSDVTPVRSYAPSVVSSDTICYGSPSPYLGGIGKLRFWLVFGGICLNTFVATFDAILMASSHPVITSYFDASNSASWLSTSFLLTATSFQPLFGRISDYVGRRRPNQVALLFFASATAWCALAPTVGQFIVARAFCGFGAGGVMVMGSIMVNDLVPMETRGTYQAYVNLFFGLGSACGAAFGGYLCDHIGWRWTFGMQVPAIMFSLLIAIVTVPSSLGPHLAKYSGKSGMSMLKEFDMAGSFLLTTCVACLVLGINLGGNIYPWSHWIVIGSLVICVVTGIALVKVESAARRPVMPLAVLSNKPQANLIWNNFFAAMGINTIMFNAPLYFNAVKLESASSSGLRLMAPSIAVTVCGCFAGFAMTHSGRITWLITAGSVFMLIGGVCMATMWHDIPAWLATVFVVPTSIGQGFNFPAASLAVLISSPQEDQAVVTSMLTLGRSLGVVLGVAVSSGILENALEVFLNSYVSGPDKATVILRVRKSVHAILSLPEQNRAEVIHAYEESLRLTYLSAVVIFIITIWLLWPVRLPKLGRHQMAGHSYGGLE